MHFYCSQPKLAKSDGGRLKTHGDLVQYTGVISSRVFGASRNTIGDIESYIRCDIIRSLTTRMQIYYDALLANDDGGNDDSSAKDQDVNSTNPPRRVFYPIGCGDILFGDYLFQNETADTTVKQSMDILNLNLTASAINTKSEAIAQLDASSSAEKSECPSNSSDEALSVRDTGRLVIIIGIAGALIALLVAIVFHFVSQ
jgi:Odorant response abnormal 4-like